MQKADGALQAIPPPADRDTWLQITTAYKAAGGDYETWDKWSAQGDGYNQRANLAAWKSIDPQGGITAATLFAEAIKNGWTDHEPGVYTHTHIQREAAPRKPQTATPGQTRNIQAYTATAASNAAGIAEYCRGRGLTSETVKRFHMGYDTAAKRLVIPYPAAAYYVSRSISIPPNGEHAKEPKYKYPTKAEAGDKPLFNIPALNAAPTVYITEGQIDAITLEQQGAAAIASTEPETVLQAIQTAGTTAAAFIIVPDNDTAGQGKAAAMLDALTAAGRAAYIYPLPQEYHDVNDMQIRAAADLYDWTRNAAGYIEKLKREALERYQRITGAGRLPGFLDTIHTNAPAVKTGYPTLDLELGDGALYPAGLYAGLYIIGAISSLGKTTFFLQMADQIAQGGRDCLIFSLEMSAAELMAKSISRLTTQTATSDRDKKTMRGITQGNRYARYSQEEQDTIHDAITLYRKYANRLYIIEGTGEIGAAQIRETVKRHAELTGKPPVVFVDYLQILSPVDMKATDKQNTDRAVLELKRISRDYSTPIIAISSFNRENYSAAASMSAFKESGAVEYSSDVLLALQLKGAGSKDFDTNAAKSKDPREIELVILKNRNGATGAVIPFEYTPRFNLFHDVKQGHRFSQEEAAAVVSNTLKRYTTK